MEVEGGEIVNRRRSTVITMAPEVVGTILLKRGDGLRFFIRLVRGARVV